MSQENPISKQPLIRHVNRQQMSWRAVDVEHLISEDHPARAISTLVGRLNLSAFYQAIESSTEEGGRPAIDPQLLISLSVYAALLTCWSEIASRSVDEIGGRVFSEEAGGEDGRNRPGAFCSGGARSRAAGFAFLP